MSGLLGRFFIGAEPLFSGNYFRQHLQRLHPTLIQETDTSLPQLTESNRKINDVSILYPNEQLFLIGSSTYRDLSSHFDPAQRITLSTNLTDHIQNVSSRFQSGLPNFSGMSGDSVILCDFNNNQNSCSLVETLFGTYYLPSESSSSQIHTHVNKIRE